MSWREAVNNLGYYGFGSPTEQKKPQYKGPVTARTTEYTSPDDAYGSLLEAMTRLLGRAPTSKEVSQLQAVLAAAEAANPKVGTVTPLAWAPSTDQDVMTNSRRTVSGGVNPKVQAEAFIKSQQPTRGESATYALHNLVWFFERAIRG